MLQDRLQNCDTMKDLLNQVIFKHGTDRLISSREGNKWKTYSSADVEQEVTRLSCGLAKLGINSGDRVALLIPSSAHWVFFDLALLSIGAINIPVFVNVSQEVFEHQMEHAEVSHLVVEDEAFFEEFTLENCTLTDLITLESAKPQSGLNINSYSEVMTLGERSLSQDPTAYSKLLENGNAEDLLTIIYTSGSTGLPKGVELSHKNLLHQVKAVSKLLHEDLVLKTAISCLPVAHTFERMIIYFYLAMNIHVYIADDVKKTADYAKEIKPDMMTMVPRLLEKIYEAMEKKIRSQKGFKARLARIAFLLAYHRINPFYYLCLPIFDRLVYSKFRAALGGELKALILGGAALNPRICSFFIKIGVPVFQGYGLTESSPVITSSSPRSNKIGFVGKAIEGTEIKLSERGEVLTKSDSVMRGYHKNPEATSDVILPDGWLRTGDKGVIDNDGFLRIVGRIKEIFKTSNGKYIAPISIERHLTKSKYIESAMLVAEGRKFPSCLLFMDLAEIEKLKRKKKMTDLGVEEFVASKYLKAKIQQYIENINRGLSHWEQIRKFRLVVTPLTIESGELTPTMKIKRFVIEEKYNKLIESMYSEPN
ncbi:MAG: long-chain fatty acid--CoA ligase [Candidatus Cloacimonetes bacterium]|nr:long-chain fatty acid--CoA ligase [Candidatus Cloacimonadota bacterium]